MRDWWLSCWEWILWVVVVVVVVVGVGKLGWENDNQGLFRGDWFGGGLLEIVVVEEKRHRD